MKTLRISFALFLVAALLMIPVSAALGFTPSVTQSGAGFVSSEVNSAGVPVVGYIQNADGTVVPGLTSANTQLVPLSKAEEAPEAIRDMLEKAEQQLKELATSSIIDDFAKAWADATEGAPVENAVVAYVFDVSTNVQIPAGATASFTVDNPGIDSDVAIMVIHNYEGDKWEVVPHTRNANGDITITVKGFSPFAIVADNATAPIIRPEAPKSPSTFENVDNIGIVMGVVALVALAGIGFVKVTKHTAK